VAGSPLLAADRALVAELAGAGEVLRGFAPAVEEVTAAEPDGDRMELELVDSRPGYKVVAADRPEGAALRTDAGRGSARVRMVLVRAGDGWLIESAEREG
jgi:eukaryotic-like serine/threonine-protein kinase